MSQYFFDTSALVRRYHEEEGTPRVREIFDAPGIDIRISTLREVEIHSAFAVKVRAGQLTLEAAQILSDGVLADLVSGRIVPHAVRDRHFAAAQLLVRRFAFDHRLRSLDAIQLAVASDLRAQGLVEYLVTADPALHRVAAEMGFDVVNPQTA